MRYGKLDNWELIALGRAARDMIASEYVDRQDAGYVTADRVATEMTARAGEAGLGPLWLFYTDDETRGGRQRPVPDMWRDWLDSLPGDVVIRGGRL